MPQILSPEIITNEEIDEQDIDYWPCSLVVYNDDVNTFEHVVASFVEVLGHDPIQAEQCALIIHCTGSYAVKKGTQMSLLPYANGLIGKGLDAQIE